MGYPWLYFYMDQQSLIIYFSHVSLPTLRIATVPRSEKGAPLDHIGAGIYLLYRLNDPVLNWHFIN